MPLQIETQPFQFNQNVTIFGSVSAPSLSGAFYGDGSRLTGVSGLPIYGTANQITSTAANNSVTLSLPNNVNITTLNVLSTLNVAGSANFFNTNNLNVSSNIIYFGEGNTANALDLGLVTHFVDGTNNRYQHTGLVRKAGQSSPGVWTLFSGLTTEPGSNSGINWTDRYLTVDTLSANILGNLSGSFVTVGTGNSNQWNNTYSYVSTTSANNNPTYNANCYATCAAVPYTDPQTNYNQFAYKYGANTINTNSGYCGQGGNNFILAGVNSNITNSGTYHYTCNNTVVGGRNHTINGGDYSCQFYNTIVGGTSNQIIGNNNTVSGYTRSNTIAGGENNCIISIAYGNTSCLSFIAAGVGNVACGVCNAFILGSNIKTNVGNYTFVNNLSSQGTVVAANGNSNQWNSVYNYITSTSATNNPTYNATTYSPLSTRAYTLVTNTSSIRPVVGNNIASNNGTLALYYFNGNYNDSSTYNRPLTSNGTLISSDTKYAGMSSIYIPIVEGSSVTPNEPIKIGNINNDLNIGTDDFTVSLNFKTSDANSYVPTILFDCGAIFYGITGGFCIYISGNQVWYQDRTNSFSQNGSIASNTWYNCTVTRKNGNVTLCIGGVSPAVSYLPTYHDTQSLNYFTIGDYVGGGGNTYGSLLIQDFQFIKGYATTNYNPTPASLSAAIVQPYQSAVLNGSANIARGQYSTIVSGLSNSISDNYDFIGNGSNNRIAGDYSSILHGANNTILGLHSSILGGCCNTNSGCYNTIIGGNNNSSVGTSNVVIGGTNNINNGTSNIIAGVNNTNCGCFSVIDNGHNNSINARTCLGFIGGSTDNSAISGNGIGVLNGCCVGCNNIFNNVTILGGSINQICSTSVPYSYYDPNSCSNQYVAGAPTINYSSILGGTRNTIYSCGCTVVNQYNTINNGSCNLIANVTTDGILNYNTVVNGQQLSATGSYNFLANGQINKATGLYASILNGCYNIASSTYSLIGNGGCNAASGNYSIVANGCCNTASGLYSTVINGVCNVITSNSLKSTIVNGSNNTLTNDILQSTATYLLHFDTTVNNSYATNSSGLANSYVYVSTGNGIVLNSSFKKFGAASLDTTYEYNAGRIYTGQGSIITGTQDFTIDCWIYTITSGPNNQYILGTYNGSTPTGRPYFYLDTSNFLHFRNLVTSTNVVPINTWTHVAVSRYNGTTTLYINGNIEASSTDSLSYPSAGSLSVSPIFGAQRASGVGFFQGYIDEFRSLNGYSAYKGQAFIPPTTPYADGVGSSLIQGSSNYLTGEQSAIFGSSNSLSSSNSFILGSNISSNVPNYTFVNNLSSQGTIAASGGNNSQWNAAYQAINTIFHPFLLGGM